MKFTEINDLNLKEWKEIREELYITTNALWYTGHDDYNLFKIPKRDFLPENSKTFHGLFIPEIPYQDLQKPVKQYETRFQEAEQRTRLLKYLIESAFQLI